MPTCENKLCGRPFKRTRTWQKYCSGTCRSAARNQGIRQRTVSPVGHEVLEAAMDWYETGGTFALQEQLRNACGRYALEVPAREEP